jgi:hypothetical protein
LEDCEREQREAGREDADEDGDPGESERAEAEDQRREEEGRDEEHGGEEVRHRVRPRIGVAADLEPDARWQEVRDRVEPGAERGQRLLWQDARRDEALDEVDALAAAAVDRALGRHERGAAEGAERDGLAVRARQVEVEERVGARAGAGGEADADRALHRPLDQRAAGRAVEPGGEPRRRAPEVEARQRDAVLVEREDELRRAARERDAGLEDAGHPGHRRPRPVARLPERREVPPDEAQLHGRGDRRALHELAHQTCASGTARSSAACTRA